MMSFLDLTDLGAESSQSDLANLALGYLSAALPGYTPQPADLEVILAEALSLIAADTAATALTVPSAVFRAFGTKLVGVPYQYGQAAQTQVTFTLIDTSGHTVPAQTGITLNGLGFYTATDLTIAPGSSTATVTVYASASGSAYNGASSPALLVSPLPFVSSVTVTTPAYGGVDQEDDTAYQNRLVTELSLQAPRPITAGDYASMALSFPPAAGTDQQEVGRATAVDGYSTAATVFTGNTTSGSATVSSVSSFTGLSAGTTTSPGSIITGAGIPANTTIVSVNTGASTLVLSANATATATGVSLTSTGSYGNARTVSVWVSDALGGALNSDTLTAVKAWFQSYREVNFVVNVLSPTYTTVYVTASVHPYPGVNTAAVQSAVQAAILAYLSPVNWGIPSVTGGTIGNWYNQPWVRYNRLISVIENVRGVDYAPTGAVTVGLSASPTGVTDLLLPGPVPLPRSTTVSVPLPTIV